MRAMQSVIPCNNNVTYFFIIMDHGYVQDGWLTIVLNKVSYLSSFELMIFFFQLYKMHN